MHGAEQLGRAVALGRRHAFPGRPKQGFEVGLPADQDRLLVVGREAWRADHVVRSAEHRLRVELSLVEIDQCNVYRTGSSPEKQRENVNRSDATIMRGGKRSLATLS